MAKYTVYLTATASTSVEVDAEDRDDAIEKALSANMPTICAQCSGWGREYSLEIADNWDFSEVEDQNGNIVGPEDEG
jgi:hypothetical protein